MSENVNSASMEEVQGMRMSHGKGLCAMLKLWMSDQPVAKARLKRGGFLEQRKETQLGQRAEDDFSLVSSSQHTYKCDFRAPLSTPVSASPENSSSGPGPASQVATLSYCFIFPLPE